MIKTLSVEDNYGVGPKRLLLIGPPGTGKTYAALESWVFPALKQGVRWHQIACLSFSNAAASELRGRVQSRFNLKPEQLREMCSTIHSEALRRISTTGGKWQLYDGISRNFKTLGGARDPIEEVNGSSIRGAAISIWDYVRSLCREDDVEFIRAVTARVKSSSPGMTASVQGIMGNIAAYEKEKKSEANGIDFTDMLKEAVRVPGRPLKLLIIDEAQDCSPLQWKVVENWVQYAETVVLIGDGDQCIHEYAGASPDEFVRHIDEGYEVRKLAQSYRVPKKVHEFARRIILRNKDRIDAEYLPTKDEGDIRYLTEKRILDLAKESAHRNDWAYTEEEEIMADLGDYELPDPVPEMFLLARDRKGCARYARLLDDHGIPFIHERGTSLHTATARLACALAVIQFTRGESVRHRELAHYVKSLPVRGTNFFPKAPKAQVLKWLRKSQYTKEDISAIGLNLNLSEVDLLKASKNINADQAEKIQLMVNTFGVKSLELPPNVIVTTMHASKGREAQNVVVSARKPFPVQLRYDNQSRKDIEAERRALYVAATRARQTLIIDKNGKEIYRELV